MIKAMLGYLSFPKISRIFVSINLLEFVAAIIMICRILHQKPWLELCKILAFTDSSSALKWLYKSSFSPVHQELHDNIARNLA